MLEDLFSLFAKELFIEVLLRFAVQSQMAGNFVKTVEAEDSVSRARTLDRGMQ